MAITVTVHIKHFNEALLQEELEAASLPIQGMNWAGFIRSGDLIYTPFPEATRYAGTSSSNGDEFAARDELRFYSPSPLTAEQSNSLMSVLAAHNSATLTAEQIRINQDISELNALLATDNAVYRNHLGTQRVPRISLWLVRRCSQ